VENRERTRESAFVVAESPKNGAGLLQVFGSSIPYGLHRIEQAERPAAGAG